MSAGREGGEEAEAEAVQQGVGQAVPAAQAGRVRGVGDQGEGARGREHQAEGDSAPPVRAAQRGHGEDSDRLKGYASSL